MDIATTFMHLFRILYVLIIVIIFGGAIVGLVLARSMMLDPKSSNLQKHLIPGSSLLLVSWKGPIDCILGQVNGSGTARPFIAVHWWCTLGHASVSGSYSQQHLSVILTLSWDVHLSHPMGNRHAVHT